MSSTGTQTLATPLTIFTTPLSVVTQATTGCGIRINQAVSALTNVAEDHAASPTPAGRSPLATGLGTLHRRTLCDEQPRPFKDLGSTAREHQVCDATDGYGGHEYRTPGASKRVWSHGTKPPGRSTPYAAYPFANPCGISLGDETRTSPPFTTLQIQSSRLPTPRSCLRPARAERCLPLMP